MENKNTALSVITSKNASADSSLIIKLGHAYTFDDGQQISEVDLSNLANMTAADMIAAESYLSRAGIVTATPELSLPYNIFLAARASGLPIEFFSKLSVNDAPKIKNAVSGFLYRKG